MPTHEPLNLNRRQMRNMIAYLLVALCLSGCASLEQAQQRRQEKNRQQQSRRDLAFTRPDAQISVSPLRFTKD